MKKSGLRSFLLLTSAMIISSAIYIFIQSGYTDIKPSKIPKRDRIELAWEQEFEMTKDLSLGYVPIERLIPAFNYVKASLAARTNEAIPGIQWTALGPKNFGGRTRALMVDLNDPTRKTIWAGSVGGGLWKTTDITATEPNWTPIDDLFGNLAVTSVAQDPTNPEIMYFATGEGYGNSDAVRGLGIWKSINGGVSWSQLPSTNNSSFYYNQKILVTNTGVLFSCTQSGVYRSANGGTSFTKVLGTGLGISGATSNVSYDIEQAGNGDIYATLRGNEGSSLNGSIHKSTNGGINWSAALSLPISSDRIEIAASKSNANYLYALVELGNTVNGILQSSDGGATFVTKTEPDDADGQITAADFSRGQAWYDLTIEVSPTDPLTLYVGAIDLFKSTDGGDNWGQIAHWYGGFGFQEVHADQHNIVFSPGNSNTVYFTNDGAVFRTTSGNEFVPIITSKSSNYNTLQFYGCAMNPTAGSFNFLAGAQDNGSHRFTQPVLHNTTEVTGGDGAFCHIDQDQPQYQFTSYVYNNYYRSTNGGVSFSGANHGNTGRFINPTDYDDLNNKMYCARSSNQYLRWENPQTGSTFTQVTCTELNGTVSAVKVSPNTPNRVFFGTSNGNVVKVDDAHIATPLATTINPVAPMPSGYISCIEVQPGNDDHILVTFSNYGSNSIWETNDGGVNWVSVEGNLPDMPVRWIIFNPINNDQALIATELGVWSTDNLNGTSTNWGATNNGLANVRVDMLQTRSSDKMIIAATHGRGLYYTGAFSPASASFITNSQIIYPGRVLQFTNTSVNATSNAWNFGDGNTSILQNPVKKYTTPGTYTVTLSINGGSSTAVKNIIVMPMSGTPYTPSQGGNFDVNANHFVAETIAGTGWEKGNSTITAKSGTNSGANAWVTGLTTSVYTNNSESYLYGPSYNLSATGVYNFSFYTKYAFEPDYDGFRIEYSLDTGKNWIPLSTTIATNWYNFANTAGTTAFPQFQAYFSATQSSFTKKNYDISFLSGNNQVAFRFAFKADGGVTAAGVAIDDVEITGSVNPPLPLNLLSFTATKENKDALLKWITANEVNVSHFEIERSWTGTEFSAVGRVNALNRIGNAYSFKDLLSRLSVIPSNTTYYRLKMVDRDGKFSYSPIQSLKWQDIQNIQVAVSPNPFKDYLQLTTQLRITQVQLIDNNGRIVAATRNLSNGRFNLPSLPVGSYFVRIHTAEGIITEKVMKQ
jgi:PKD repeat protein